MHIPRRHTSILSCQHICSLKRWCSDSHQQKWRQILFTLLGFQFLLPPYPPPHNSPFLFMPLAWFVSTFVSSLIFLFSKYANAKSKSLLGALPLTLEELKITSIFRIGGMEKICLQFFFNQRRSGRNLLVLVSNYKGFIPGFDFSFRWY